MSRGFTSVTPFFSVSREPTLADIGRYESRCGYGASLRREQLPATRTSTFPPRRRVVVVVAVSIPFYFLLIPPPSLVHRATTTPPPSALFIFFPLFPSLPFLFPFLSHARAVRGRLTLGEDERPFRAILLSLFSFPFSFITDSKSLSLRGDDRRSIGSKDRIGSGEA